MPVLIILQNYLFNAKTYLNIRAVETTQSCEIKLERMYVTDEKKKKEKEKRLLQKIVISSMKQRQIRQKKEVFERIIETFES